jgi:hypothetical protein
MTLLTLRATLTSAGSEPCTDTDTITMGQDENNRRA